MADIKPKAVENKEGDPASERSWCAPGSPSSTGQGRATTNHPSNAEFGPPCRPQQALLSRDNINGASSHSEQEVAPQLSHMPKGNSATTDGPNVAVDTLNMSPKFPKGLSSAKLCKKDRVREGFFFAKSKPPPETLSKDASESESASDSESSNSEPPRRQTQHKRLLNESDGHRQTSKRKSSGSSLWDFGSESSESTSEDGDGDGDFTWEPHNEFVISLLSSTKRAELASASHSRRKRRLNTADRLGDGSQVSSAKQPVTHDSSNDKDRSCSKEHNVSTKPKAKASVMPHTDQTLSTVDSKEHFINSEEDAGRKSREEEDTESVKSNHTSAEPTSDVGSEPFVFPCTKCNVNFKEKAHLHRHMLQHQAPPRMGVPRPFICRECGRSFRDGNTLQKHMLIHQVRRERLMEEIKGLSEIRDEGRQARLQCPQCVFGTECPKTFVQHAKTHERDKRYYCCDACNYMATSPQDLDGHRRRFHPHAFCPNTDSAREFKHFRGRKDAKFKIPGRITLLYCKICLFSTQNRNILKKHTELIHRQPYFEENDEKEVMEEDDEEEQEVKQKKPGVDMHSFHNQAKSNDLHPSQLRPKLNLETLTSGNGDAKESLWGDATADPCVQNNRVSPKAQKGLSLPVLKWSFGTSTNKLSSSLLRLNKPSKASSPPTAKKDLTASLLGDKDGNLDCPESRPVGEAQTTQNADSQANSEAKSDGLNQEAHLNHKADRECSSSTDGTGERESPPKPVPHRTLSKRKMSIPYHNTLKPKPEPTSPALSEDYDDDDDEDDDDDSFDFRDYSATLLDSSESKHIPFMPSKPLYLPPPSQLPLRGDFLQSNGSEDEESDCDDIQDLVIKEECEETALSLDGMSADSIHESLLEQRQDSPTFGGDQKSCPYCPAMFESGVGLSNHVRGHLHRVGLSYDARHMVTAEQVASKDRQLRIRRKPPSAISRRLKKAVDKPETETEHTCPLCWGWFDTRTGLSNHVRGHLKRIGRGLGSSLPGSPVAPATSSSRSPLCILNELLRDETEHRSLLALLGRRPSQSRHFVSQKFASSEGLFLTPTGIPIKVQHPKARVGTTVAEPKPQQWTQQKEDTLAEGRKKEKKVDALRETIKMEIQGPVDRAPSPSLAELLRRRKRERDQLMEMRVQTHVARRQLPVSPARETGGRLAALKPDPGWSQGKLEGKKVCVHCNQTFHSAVSLSNHLRAYARRKRAALLEGTTYECKQKKPRSRPGPKKKMFSLSHSPEEIYRLTCRFCDLVFQGPLSVQEDWIKHLQRHIMHTSVPHTGAAMVEVTAVCKELPPPPPPERLILPSQEPQLQVPPTVS